MEISEKSEFVRLLTATMGAYGKPLPEAGILAAWWAELSLFPLRVVAAAFAAYKVEDGKFAPLPAGIAQRCVLMDGRPGVEEAWAIALTSRDEAETIVWTQEMAEAFALCSPLLNGGDSVGARMAFKDVYTRLVASARLNRNPVRWSPSLGWDKEKRITVLERAVKVGLLPAPSVAGLLPPPVSNETYDEKVARENLEKIKAQLAAAMSPLDRAWQERSKQIEANRREIERRKAEIAKQVEKVMQ